MKNKHYKNGKIIMVSEDSVIQFSARNWYTNNFTFCQILLVILASKSDSLSRRNTG